MQTGINLMIRKSPNLSTSVVKSSITMTKIGLIFIYSEKYSRIKSILLSCFLYMSDRMGDVTEHYQLLLEAPGS